jgi:hypothetical protein
VTVLYVVPRFYYDNFISQIMEDIGVNDDEFNQRFVELLCLISAIVSNYTSILIVYFYYGLLNGIPIFRKHCVPGWLIKASSVCSWRCSPN